MLSNRSESTNDNLLSEDLKANIRKHMVCWMNTDYAVCAESNLPNNGSNKCNCVTGNSTSGTVNVKNVWLDCDLLKWKQQKKYSPNQGELCTVFLGLALDCRDPDQNKAITEGEWVNEWMNKKQKLMTLNISKNLEMSKGKTDKMFPFSENVYYCFSLIDGHMYMYMFFFPVLN